MMVTVFSTAFRLFRAASMGNIDDDDDNDDNDDDDNDDDDDIRRLKKDQDLTRPSILIGTDRIRLVESVRTGAGKFKLFGDRLGSVKGIASQIIAEPQLCFYIGNLTFQGVAGH